MELIAPVVKYNGQTIGRDKLCRYVKKISFSKVTFWWFDVGSTFRSYFDPQLTRRNAFWAKSCALWMKLRLFTATFLWLRDACHFIRTARREDFIPLFPTKYLGICNSSVANWTVMLKLINIFFSDPRTLQYTSKLLGYLLQKQGATAETLKLIKTIEVHISTSRKREYKK